MPQNNELTTIEPPEEIVRSAAKSPGSVPISIENPRRLNRAIFIMLMAMPIFSVIAYGAVDAWMIGVNSVIAGLIAAFWLIDAARAKTLRFNSSRLLLPFLGLIVIGIIQLLPLRSDADATAILSSPAAAALSLDPYLTRLFVIQLLVALVFFAAALTFIDNRKRFQSVILTIIIFSSLMAFYGILQYLANPEALYGLRSFGQSSPFASFFNKHHFASFMEMTLGLTLGLLFGGATHSNKRIFLIIAAVIMGMALLLTGSRGGIISFLGVLIFVIAANFIDNRRIESQDDDGESRRLRLRRNLILFGGGVALIGLLLVAVLFIGGDQSLLRGIGLNGAEGDFTTGRSHFWLIALRIFFDHPVIGTGFDSFGVAFTRYDTWSGAFRIEQAHNDYFQILSDSGVLGFICIASFIYILFKHGVRSVGRHSDKFVKNGTIGALAGCFGILIHSFFDFPLRTPSNSLYFLLLAALVVVPLNFRQAHRQKNG